MDKKAAVLKKIEDNINKHKWTVMYVGPGEDSPSFAYTIGLMEHFGHPDIVMFSLPFDAAEGLAYNIVENILKPGQTCEEGFSHDKVAEGLSIRFLTVAKQEDCEQLSVLRHYNAERGLDLAVMQMVWPDSNNTFPWEEAFDPALSELQPLLGDPNAVSKPKLGH